jgi:Ca-activated chloride channel family protein
MTTGLTTSLDMEGRPGTLRLVVMLTDGFVNNEAEIGAVVSEHLGGSRLFALGIGGSVNRYLLEGLAEMGHGDVMVQLPGTPIRETVDAFYERISHPAMSHIDIEWDGLEVSEQYPRVLPDLWAGQPLRVVARYTGEPPESITIRGTVGWKRIEIVADVEAREEGSKVARLWARRKLADVERYPRTRTRDQVREELTELALDYGLVSRWTSLVAVDEVPCPCADVDFVRFTVPHERPKDTLLGGMGLGGGGYGAGLGGLGTRGYGRGSSDYGTGTIGLGKREPVIMGSVDHSMIEEVIKGQLNAVRACYNVQLRTEPGLEGRLVLRFEVAGDGRLVRTTAVSNTTGSEDLADCVTSRFFMMRFPASLGGGELVVNYPFVFAGADLAVE